MTEAPASSEITKRKRKRRAVLSCNDCRRRKLKCNRELPCNRCLAGGYGKTCAYGQDSLADYVQTTLPSRNNPPNPTRQSAFLEPTDDEPTIMRSIHATSPKLDTIEQLQNRIASLESLLLSRPIGDALSGSGEAYDPGTSKCETNTTLVSLFKGRGYAIFAYGPTSPVTIVVNFPELRPFMKSLYPDSTLERLLGDIKALESRARSNSSSNRVITVQCLRNLLPDRQTVDLLVQRYMDTFETTYRIIHRPTFWASYETFWESEAGSNSDMEALLLAILACVLCTSTHEAPKYNPNGSTSRSKAIVWIKACETWLKRQSNKHRSLTTLQVRCLRLLALKTTCLKTKEFYQEVHAYIGFMKAIGMHRDPAVIGGRCSVFEGEMRRRLWATSVELELQVSVDRGVSSSLSGLDSDCAAPSNINDAELTVDMQKPPLSHPTSAFKDSSFLHLAAQTSNLRTKLCNLINRYQRGLDFRETLDFEQDVHRAIENIPRWSDPRSLQAWTHLDLLHRQWLVLLHTPKVFQTHLRSQPHHRYALLSCVETSVMLIDRHMTLLESSNFTLSCIRSDYYRAALIICYITYHASKTNDTFVLRVAQTFFGDAIEKALRLQEERSMRPGRGNHQYWYVSAAYSLVRIQLDPAREEVLKQQACDKVSRLLYKVLALQDDSSDDYMANEVVLSDLYTTATRTTSNPDPVELAQSASLGEFSSGSLHLDDFDFGGTSEWMLDDFWFFDDLPLLRFGDSNT